jgi:DNA invertase Pin-like site-specific DNA recombinase
MHLLKPKIMVTKPRRTEPKRYGYARVSTTGQTLDAQLEQLAVAGCSKVFEEQASGRKMSRKELMRLLDQLKPGDEVVVTRIDRLARSTLDLFAIIKRVEDAGARFRSLAEPWADTSTSGGRLMLAILGGLADVERDMIVNRTQEGRKAAKARGAVFGRPHILTDLQKGEARARYAAGEIISDLARRYNVGEGTIARICRGVQRKVGRVRRTQAEIEAIRAEIKTEK